MTSYRRFQIISDRVVKFNTRDKGAPSPMLSFGARHSVTNFSLK